MTRTAQTVEAAPAEAEFPQVADRYRRELFAHCYRMTGSVHDAEDLVQETYLRAWKAYHAFENRSSLRTWLYRIATNTCLTSLEGRNRRPLPVGLGGPSARPGDDLEENHEVPWLEPVPDAMVGDERADPAELAVSRETIRLAFVAALQFLPARQRAVLLLRDVLRWSAAEVAEAMQTSSAAVNSLLQRAHAQLEQAGPLDESVADASMLSAQQQEMLERYVAAFWEKDVDTLVTMFTQDAIWEMPPFLNWYRGPHDIGKLIGEHCPGGRHDMRMVETVANGQPAFALYMRSPEGDFRPFHLQVLSIGPGGVHHVAAFFELSLFAKFGLPEALPAGDASAGGAPAAALAGAVALVERAVGYTRGSLQLVRPDLLRAPTPCERWNLNALLVHMYDSLSAMHEAADLGRVTMVPVGEPGVPIVNALQDKACALLGAWVSQSRAALIVGDDAMTSASTVAATGALEI